MLICPAGTLNPRARHRDHRLRASKHPQWYCNLKAHPEFEFGGEKLVATEVTDPDEHTRVYTLAEHVYAGYGDYRVKAGSAGRRIPVFRLMPR